ncbi:MAG: hypothetical protein U0353_33015 [Sandaracinus sp.]
MNRWRVCALCVLYGVCASCGSDEVVLEGDPIPEDALDTLDPGGLYVELELRRTAGTVTVVSSRWLDAEVGLARAYEGDHMLVSRDGAGNVEDAVFFSFPTVAHREGRDASGEPFDVETSVADDSVVFVRVLASESTSELAVLDASGATALTLASPAGRDGALLLPRTGSELDGAGGEPLIEHSLADYPHIAILEPGDMGSLPAGLGDPTDGDITRLHAWSELPDRPRMALLDELRRLPPAVVRSIARIGVGDLRELRGADGRVSEIYASQVGNVIVFNVAMADSPSFVGTMVHEGVHVYDASLGSDVSETGVSWPADVLETARTRLRNSRLRVSLRQSWASLHDAAVGMRFAVAYDATTQAAFRGRPTTETGVVESYGGTNVREDIATYATRLIMSPSLTADVCSTFRAENRITPQLATIYGKMLLLRSVGIVTRDQVHGCTGPIGFRAPPGITVITPESRLRYGLNRDVVARFDAGNTKLVFTANDATYRGLLEMPTRDGAAPLGFHRLSEGGPAGLYVDRRTGMGDDFYSTGGLLFLAEVQSTTDSAVAVGFVLGVTMHEDATLGRTEVLPYGVFRYQR